MAACMYIEVLYIIIHDHTHDSLVVDFSELCAGEERQLQLPQLVERHPTSQSSQNVSEHF